MGAGTRPHLEICSLYIKALSNFVKPPYIPNFQHQMAVIIA